MRVEVKWVCTCFVLAPAPETGLYRVKPASVKLLKWVVFSVALAVAPLLLNALRCITRKDIAFTLTGLLERGELLLVSAAIAASAVGDLATSGITTAQKSKIVLGGIASGIILLSSWLFADISVGWQVNTEQMSSDGITLISCWLFAAAVVTGACCTALSD